MRPHSRDGTGRGRAARFRHSRGASRAKGRGSDPATGPREEPSRGPLPRGESPARPSPVRQNDSVGEFLIEDFIRLETQVWRALANGDADADGRMLSDDFLGVYPTGFANRTDHVGQLADGPTVATFALHDARMIAVSESAEMLSYRAEFERRTSDASSGVQAMYVSSLWCRRGEKWLNVFSQDTPGG